MDFVIFGLLSPERPRPRWVGLGLGVHVYAAAQHQYFFRIFFWKAVRKDPVMLQRTLSCRHQNPDIKEGARED
jgi:hypothetical protein